MMSYLCYMFLIRTKMYIYNHNPKLRVSLDEVCEVL